MVEGRKEGRKGREKEVERIREWTAEAEESRIWPIRNPLVCAQIGCYLSAVEDTEPHKGTRGCATHTVNAHNRDQIFESFWTRSFSTDPNHPSPGGDLTVEPCAVILSTRFWVPIGWFVSSVTGKGSVNRISSNYWTEHVTVLNRHLTCLEPWKYSSISNKNYR